MTVSRWTIFRLARDRDSRKIVKVEDRPIENGPKFDDLVESRVHRDRKKQNGGAYRVQSGPYGDERETRLRCAQFKPKTSVRDSPSAPGQLLID